VESGSNLDLLKFTNFLIIIVGVFFLPQSFFSACGGIGLPAQRKQEYK